MTDDIRDLLNKAQQSIEAASVLLRDGFADFAAGRAYYAMFYTTEALLLSKDLAFSKHSAVIAAFGKEFVKTGCFSSRFHRALIDAFDLRNTGDYGTTHAVTGEQVRSSLEQAQELLATAVTFLERQDSGPKGFTLVELAVSMVVIGVLLGLGISMVGPLMTSIKVRESRENLGAAVESLNSYASGNNRLPDSSSSYPSSSTHWKNVAKTPADAWGRDFLYLYDTNLAPATATKDTICGRRSTFISLTDTNTGAVIPNVAYLMLSQADDAATDTKIGSTAVSTGPRTAATAITADTVNDLVRWVTLDELRTKAGCQGAQLKIVNNELPFGSVGAAYPTVTITVDGGATPGTYRWCIESLAVSPLPTGLAFSTTTPALPVRVTPGNTCSSHAEANWGEVTTAPNFLTITGTPGTGTHGSYSFTVYVRDNNDTTGNNDNIASKTFVLTINPN